MKKRVFSAIVLLSITLPCILLSEYSRTILFAVAACLCAYEWFCCQNTLAQFCSLWRHVFARMSGRMNLAEKALPA